MKKEAIKKAVELDPLRFQPEVFVNDNKLFPQVAKMYTLEDACFKYEQEIGEGVSWN